MTDDIVEVKRMDIGRLGTRILVGRNIKVIVFRNDRPELPHFTISFGNASGEIDLHLTLEGSEKTYAPLAKIQQSSLFEIFYKIGAEFEQVFIEEGRRLQAITIPQLVRRGYRILYCPSDKIWEVIDLIAPREKRKGRWRRTISNDSASAFESVDVRSYIHPPSFLHNLEVSPPGDPVFAFREQTRQLPQIIPLKLLFTLNGIPLWVRVDNFLKMLENHFANLMPTLINDLIPNGVGSMIEEVLRLDETQPQAARKGQW